MDYKHKFITVTQAKWRRMHEEQQKEDVSSTFPVFDFNSKKPAIYHWYGITVRPLDGYDFDNDSFEYNEESYVSSYKGIIY